MKKVFLLTGCLLMAGSILAAETLAASPASVDQPLPSGADLMRRILERSTAQAAATNAPAWAYDKRQVMEKLDSDGKVKERTVKLYQMHIVQGVPISQLVKIEGRDLTEAEIKKERQRDAAMEKEFSGRDPKKTIKKREALVTKELLDRFEFKTLRRETVLDHPAVVVSFEGKPGKDDGNIQERILSRMAGTVWMDEATADVARLEVHLTKSFSIGILGVLGSVKDCKMEMVSKRMTDGTWLPEKTKLSVSARMLVSSVRFQMEELASNFKLEPVAQALPP
jgi:hypothetical protein